MGLDTATFTLYMALIASGMTCMGIFLNFIIKSRCTRLSCCGRECIVRDVVPAEQAALDLSQIPAPRFGGATPIGPLTTRT
jgi:hypothetical protein